MRSAQPPAFAHWLVKTFGCSPNNDAVIGDLDERYHQGHSYIWYWKQAFQAIATSFFNEVWGHKLLAIRALLSGWIIKVMWMSVFESTYGRPPQRLFHEGIETSLLIGLVGVLTMMGSGWIIARTHRAHYRALVLLFIAVEVIGGFSNGRFSFYYWTPPMGKIITAVLYHVGIIRPAAAQWEGAAIMVMSVLFGAGFFSTGEAPRVIRRASQ
jgi:hypothetical protein